MANVSNIPCPAALAMFRATSSLRKRSGEMHFERGAEHPRMSNEVTQGSEPRDDLERLTEQAAAALRAANFYVSVDLCCDTRGAAALLHISEKTLRNRRCEGRQPHPCHRVGRRLFFRIQDIVQLREAKKVPV